MAPVLVLPILTCVLSGVAESSEQRALDFGIIKSFFIAPR